MASAMDSEIPHGTDLKDKSVVVAAIDFGTTYSGYAFSMSTESDVHVNRNWGSARAGGQMKTATCVLTELIADKGHVFKSFGFDAEDKYAMKSSTNEGQLCLYDKFKMKLHTSSKIDQYIVDTSGEKKAETAYVFQESLRYMKQQLLDYFEEQGKTNFEQYIRWVITVPAIWNDQAKQFMRNAACKAGLISDVNSSQLRIALEPEAASLFCRQLKMNNFDGESGLKQFHMPHGTSYILMDAGGGTVDIVVHRVREDGGVDEMTVPSGGAWGGLTVNEAFFEKLAAVINKGQEVIFKLKQKHPTLWLEIESKFESLKRHFGKCENEYETLFKFGSDHIQIYSDMKGGDENKLRDDINRNGGRDFSVSHDYELMVKKHVLRTCYKDKSTLLPDGSSGEQMPVNKYFWKKLASITGNKFIRALEKHSELWKDMEDKLLRVQGLDKDQYVPVFAITIPHLRLYSRIHAMDGIGDELIDDINKNSKSGFSVNDSCQLLVKNEILRQCFENSTTSLVHHLDSILHKPEVIRLRVQYIMMVGGFSGCHLLSRAVRNHFEPTGIRVLIPEDATLAVLKGSVMFGQRPDSIKSRIARRTYGVETTMNFDPDIHMEKGKKITIDGVDKCINLFHPFVYKGDSVDLGDTVTRRFAPKTSTSKSVSFTLLATDADMSKKRIKYSDDQDIERIGYIEINLEDTRMGKDRRVELTFMFGGTELQVTAKDVSGGEIKSKKVNFTAT